MARLWDRIAAVAAMLAGALFAAAAIGHSVAVWNTAYEERGGPDERMDLLLGVGWTVLCGGLVTGLGGWALWRRKRAAYPVTAGAATFLMGYGALVRGPATGVLVASGIVLALVAVAYWRNGKK